MGEAVAEVEAGQEMQVEGVGGVDADGARDRSAESVGGSRRGGTAGASAASRSTARRAGARGVHPADGRAGPTARAALQLADVAVPLALARRAARRHVRRFRAHLWSGLAC